MDSGSVVPSVGRFGRVAPRIQDAQLCPCLITRVIMSRPKTRIAVLNSHPIQYFAPLYAYLNSAPDLDVTALYLSNISIRGGRDSGFGREVKWDVDLLDGYRAIFLGKAADIRVPAGFMSLIGPQVWNEIRSGRYDILWVNGHKYAADHIAIAAANSIGIPVMMRSETHLGLRRSGLKAIIRQPIMGAFYSLCDRFLSIGTANAAFYRAMGVPQNRIFLVPYSVDNDRFMVASQMKLEERQDRRRRLGVFDDSPIILFASKFQKRKNPDHLLKSAHRLAVEGYRFHVVMIGSGDMEPELRELVATLGMTNVSFPGFVNQRVLPQVSAACDIFVLPSENEPWGLIVNEMMCAGLPVVVSNEVGCVPDLVADGGNGLLFNAGDIHALTDALRTLIRDPVIRKKMSEAGIKRISKWGYPECLEGVRAAILSLS